MQPIKMHDTILNADVDLYNISLPDPFGANALVWWDGPKNGSHLASNPELSVYADKKAWLTVNIRRLEPID